MVLGALLKEVTLEADGLGAALQVSHEEVYKTIMPLAHWILQTRRDAAEAGRARVLIAIGGSGGSGHISSAALISHDMQPHLTHV